MTHRSSRGSRFSGVLTAWWVLLVGCLLLGRTASAACINPPGSVPGHPGLPTWFSAGADADTGITDPRWGAGPFRSFASSFNNAGYRLIADTTSHQLAVSIQVQVDPLGYDIAYLGLTQNDPPTEASVVQIELPGSAGGTASSISALHFTHWTWSSGSGWSAAHVGAIPTWLVAPDVAAAFDNPSDLVTTKWAINFKVDLTALNILSNQPFLIALGADTGASAGTATTFSTPDSSGLATLGSTPIPSDPSQWLSITQLDQGCPGGVEMHRSGIGSTNPGGPSIVDGTTGAVNTLYGEPDYTATGNVGALLSATFQVANWGSVADPAADWPTIGIDDTADGSGNFQINCTATATEVCGVTKGGTSHEHQCLQVSLNPKNGAGVNITKASAFRNMHYQNLSEVEQSATLRFSSAARVAGLSPDIYLYVNTTNMPAHGEKKQGLVVEALERLKRSVEGPWYRQRGQKPGQDDPMGKLPAARPALADSVAPTAAGAAPNAASVASAAPAANLAVPAATAAATAPPRGPQYELLTSHQKLAQVFPTYEVYPYYDSGKTRMVNGVNKKVLRAMAPFGMYLTHEGVHYGFKHSLAGVDGVKLKELSPNFYQVVYTKSANAGELRLKVKISAEEKPLSASGPQGVECPTCVEDAIQRHRAEHCHCRFVGGNRWRGSAVFLALAALLGLAFRTRRRSSRQR